MTTWPVQAACRGEPEETFFPQSGGPVYRQARQICARCPVRRECLDDALRVELPSLRFGMRAGLTPDERDAVGRGEITPSAALELAITHADTDEGSPVSITDITPNRPEPDPVSDSMPTTSDELIAWGATHKSSRLQAMAGKACGALADLRQAAEREAKVAAAEARIERLRAQLANAEQDLAAAKGKPKTAQPQDAEDYTAIRAWAKENGIEVGAVGRPKRTVIDAYHAAQATQPLANTG